MSSDERSRLLDDASKLERSISSLNRVSDEHRATFVHDRLMSAIDDICSQSKSGNGSAKFSAGQVKIIKEVAFHIVYLLDPKIRGSRGFWKRLWLDWREQGPLKQIGLAFAALSVVATCLLGAFHGFQRYGKPTIKTAFNWFASVLSDEPQAAKSEGRKSEGGLNPPSPPIVASPPAPPAAAQPAPATPKGK